MIETDRQRRLRSKEEVEELINELGNRSIRTIKFDMLAAFCPNHENNGGIIDLLSVFQEGNNILQSLIEKNELLN